MRDDFTKPTRDNLAKRVAWRCSFPGCERITIGPGHKNSSHVINLGEAAHITAASKLGPRFDSNMTKEKRKSIDNGIWMCRQHAKIIDADFTKYSASTLMQWKVKAEEETYLLLREPNKRQINIPTTLVSIGRDIVFEGFWKSVVNETWVFEITRFLLGDENSLRTYTPSTFQKNHNYVVVETQGDGRVIKENLIWKLVKGAYEITVKVGDKPNAITPYHLTDISREFKIENGDFKLVRGEECAKQIIANILSTHFGDLWFNSDFGSFFSTYYWRFKNDKELLEKLLKLEITRLVSIPEYDSTLNTESPALNFIKRVIDVEILNDKLKDDHIMIRLKLEWGDGKQWEDNIAIYINPEKDVLNK